MEAARRERKVVTVLFADLVGSPRAPSRSTPRTSTPFSVRDAPLRAALDFFRGVGASRYAREAQAGLSAIA